MNMPKPASRFIAGVKETVRLTGGVQTSGKPPLTVEELHALHKSAVPYPDTETNGVDYPEDEDIDFPEAGTDDNGRRG